MKKNTETPPFVALPVRAFVEAQDPYQVAAMVALQFHFWWKGDDHDGLGPDGVALMTKMSESKAKQVLTELESRGWVEKQSGRRDLGQKTRYRITVPPMDFKAAYKAMGVRLPDSRMTQGQLALTAPNATPPSGHVVADTGAPQSQTNSKRLDLKDSDKEIAPGAKAKHPDERVFWKEAAAQWQAWLKGKGLPETPLSWPAAKGFQVNLTKHLAKLGAIELNRRWANYLQSAWPPSKSMLNFAFDVDKWVAVDNGRKAGYVAVTGSKDFDDGEG